MTGASLVLVDPLRVGVGFVIVAFGFFMLGFLFGAKPLRDRVQAMGHREDEQAAGRSVVQRYESNTIKEHPHDLDENLLMADGAFQRHVIHELRALREQITRMEKTMSNELDQVKTATTALKASADRLNANMEKVLAKTDQLAIDLQTAIAAGADPTALTAIATQLAAISGSLDAESAKAEGDANVNPVAQAAATHGTTG